MSYRPLAHGDEGVSRLASRRDLRVVVVDMGSNAGALWMEIVNAAAGSVASISRFRRFQRSRDINDVDENGRTLVSQARAADCRAAT